MKVLLLAYAGSAHIVRWANSLSARGCAIAIASHRGWEASEYDAGIRLIRMPFSGTAGYFLNVPALRRALREEGPDILHAHFLSGYGTTARLAGFHPTIVSVWGSDIFDFPRRSPIHRRLARGNLAAADTILSTSAVMKAEILKYCPEGTDVGLSPFGVDTSRFAPGFAGRDGREITIGVAKGLYSYSGIDTLIRALASLGSPSKLRIAGDGPERGRYRALAEELGMAGKVEFMGSLSTKEMPDFFASLDIYCAPSLEESFGVSVLEASSSGLPVVASRVGGLPEVVEEGTSGLLVEPKRPEALARAIGSLVADPGLRRSMGVAGRAFVMRRYGMDACVDLMLRHYEETLRKGTMRERW
jgi:glycosyltransferase involved in cell wall biosynthesis